MRPDLRVTAQHDGASVVLQLAGELDVATAPAVRAELTEVLTRPVERVVLDLEQVAFVDVVGLGALLEAHRVTADHGGVLVLRRPSAMVRRMLELLELHDRVAVEP